MSSDKINSKIKHNLEVIPYNTNTLSFVHGLFIDVLQGLLQLAVANSDPAEDESATTNRFESDEEVTYFMQHRQGIITVFLLYVIEKKISASCTKNYKQRC